MYIKQLCRFALVVSVLTMSLVESPVALAQTADDDTALTSTIAALDAKVFDAYNRCDMDAFKDYFVPNVEFYHDKGGATFDRETVIANTKKYICNKVHRELITSTFKVYPIKDYGAIEEGEHRFCQIKTGECEGVAKFMMIWKKTGNQWQLTRIVSYGHREMTPDEKTAMAKSP